MKKTTFFLIGFLLCTQMAWSQNAVDYAAIQTKFMNWDPVRGLWIFESMKALSSNQPAPDRTFPEDLTAFEMLSLAPNGSREDIQSEILRQPTSDAFINVLSQLFSATSCNTLTGRSYGDPHIVTMDHTSYSFQTVGEFVLTKNTSRTFEVQARQKPQRDDFSLNTAVAIQMSGDRIAYYAEDIPDNSAMPLWVNGQPIRLEGRTYYLPMGGTIRLVGRNYIVSGPLGQKVIIDTRSSGIMRFVNLTVESPSCLANNYSGILGNANGNASDDFNANRLASQNGLNGFIGMNSPQYASLGNDLEQQYLMAFTKEFAEDHRVTDTNSLFNYRPGLNTSFYTDRSFPRFHRTFNSIPNQNRDQARQRCQEMGINEAEMNGCIYDNYFLNLPPNPIPAPPRATEGVVLNKLERPIVNSNTVVPVIPERNPGGGAQPMQTKPTEPVSKPQMYEPKTPAYEKPIQIKNPVDFQPANPKPSNEVKPVKTPPSISPAPKNTNTSLPSKGKN